MSDHHHNEIREQYRAYFRALPWLPWSLAIGSLLLVGWMVGREGCGAFWVLR